MPKAAKELDPVVDTAPPPVLYTIYCWSCQREIPARYWKYDKEADTYRCPHCGGKEG